MPPDPYLKVVLAFAQQNVHYVLVGVSAINYYTKSSSDILLTADFDIFLDPTEENVWKAAQILWKQGYALFARETKIRRGTRKAIETISKSLQTLRAENPDHNVVDLVLNVSGFTFEEVNADAQVFRAGTFALRVARLDKLLKMKEIADRSKDRLFLEKYRLIKNKIL